MRLRYNDISLPPMTKRLGVPAATALTERAMASTSAAARIVNLSSATESVRSAASTWAAMPETCGAAMLVPLMVAVALLLEPTHAARMLEPGACTHARGGGSVRQGERAASRWRADMHGWVR